MKQVNLKSAGVKTSMLAVLCLTLFSYAAIAGGDTYEIYLNKKLILKQRITELSSAIQNLPLDQASPKDNLVIYYSHCGVTAKGRSIIVKNEQNKILKEWKFDDSNVSMSIPVKDLLQLRKNKGNHQLNLYYFSSRQLPEGRMLASVNMGDKDLTGFPIQNKKYIAVVTAGFFGLIAVGTMMRRKV